MKPFSPLWAAPPAPLLDAIKTGQIRGAVGVVGCNNPKICQDLGHTTITRELIAHDILVLDTGCTAVANAKAGFKDPAPPRLWPGRDYALSAKP